MRRTALFRSVGILIVFSLLFSACTIAKISGRGSKALMLNNPAAKVQVVSHFTEKKMVTFDYTSAFDVSELIAEKLSASDADAVTNITIVLKTDVAAFCINVITLGIANAKIFQVEGDLVKAPEGLGSIIGDSEILAEFDNINDIKAELKKMQSDDTTELPTIVRTENGFALVR
jgi:hypothetical protein